MPLPKEANVLINGKSLSISESLTLRVAITEFQSRLLQDNDGDRITMLYQNSAKSILTKMFGYSPFDDSPEYHESIGS